MRLGLLYLFIFISVNVAVSQTSNVLFIGNSYTGVNNLPALVRSVALANGDSIDVDSNTPGGFTFEGHSTDATTIAKIYLKQWDFVVLQEQSQRPSFPPSQVMTDVYPYAHLLDSMILDNNPCSETVFYMTWGRKNGDASNCGVWPPVCTYEGMQARLRESYMEMGVQNHATVSPVGAVWSYVRSQNPAFDLYQPDESHPSIHGSYLAACTMYATMFHKSPVGTTFLGGLPAPDALLIQNAVEAVVIDSLFTWYEHGDIPVAAFSIIGCIGTTVTFNDWSANASGYLWDFGDGTTSNLPSPMHAYTGTGPYNATLYVDNGCKTDSVTNPALPCMVGIEEAGYGCYNYHSTDNTIHFECVKQVERVEMYDLRGRQIQLLNTEFSDSGFKIELPDYLTGIYFVRITGKSGAVTQKIFLSR